MDRPIAKVGSRRRITLGVATAFYLIGIGAASAADNPGSAVSSIETPLVEAKDQMSCADYSAMRGDALPRREIILVVNWSPPIDQKVRLCLPNNYKSYDGPSQTVFYIVWPLTNSEQNNEPTCITCSNSFQVAIRELAIPFEDFAHNAIDPEKDWGLQEVKMGNDYGLTIFEPKQVSKVVYHNGSSVTVRSRNGDRTEVIGFCFVDISRPVNLGDDLKDIASSCHLNAPIFSGLYFSFSIRKELVPEWRSVSRQLASLVQSFIPPAKTR